MLGEEARRLGRREQIKLVEDLRILGMHFQKKGLTGLCERLREATQQADLGLEPDNLEEIRPLMKAILGRDPLERDTRPKGEKQPGLTRSEAGGAPSLQDLRRRIYTKAKAEKAKRFWAFTSTSRRWRRFGKLTDWPRRTTEPRESTG